MANAFDLGAKHADLLASGSDAVGDSLVGWCCCWIGGGVLLMARKEDCEKREMEVMMGLVY